MSNTETENLTRKLFPNLRKKNQRLLHENENLKNEVKRLTEELERERASRKETFFTFEEIEPLVEKYNNTKKELDNTREHQVILVSV